MDRELNHYHLFIDLFNILTTNDTMNRSLPNIIPYIIKNNVSYEVSSRIGTRNQKVVQRELLQLGTDRK